MSGYPREELEAMVQRWIDANAACEAAGDWTPMAELYTTDATYGWNYGPDTDFMAVGRDQIRELALGAEMAGLDGWQYPYQEILIDDAKGQVVGFWRQVADAKRADGSEYAVLGIGGSWFRYGGDQQWSWQRDWFDFGNAAALFMEMMGDGTLSDGMTERMHRSMKGPQRGYYPAGTAPVGICDVPDDSDTGDTE